MRRLAAGSAIVAAFAGSAGLEASGQPLRAAADAPAASSPDTRCDAALAAQVSGAPDISVTSATDQPAGPDRDGRILPRHCEVIGAFDHHAGADGQAYAIRFHLRLPSPWNGRFFFQGGGGSDGDLGDALGNVQGGQPKTALQLGYAVVSQDAGHDNQRNLDPSRGGATAFGWDQRAREDYAYRSQARVTVVAKQLLAAYYGRGPDFSYWVGCSKGGQEGLALAQRYPDYFDGVVADAPGFALPKAAITQAWDAQAMARAARAQGAVDDTGLPLIGGAFSDTDLGLVAKAIERSCDRLDGVSDGIIGDFTACTTRRVTPALSALRCASAKTPACLTREQIHALVRVYGGPRDSRGRRLYSDWAWDTGIGGARDGRAYAGWRVWKIGLAGARRNDGLAVTLGGVSIASVFTTPPTPIDTDAGTLTRYVLGFDFDKDAPGIFASTRDYPVSAWTLLNAQSDLAGFRRRGGKLIIVQGVSDPVFSIRDTARWWDHLDRLSRGRAAGSARLYPVPGMNHCGGGPGTTHFDVFGALVDWVERGRAPDHILATAPADTPWPGRTRPLCAYPSTPVYRGRGDIEQAASFVCRAGRRVSEK